jgi:hypothetical protein
MIGAIVRYAANRAISGAVDSAARHASWGVAAMFLMGVGTIFILIVAFWILDARYSSTVAGFMIAAVCFAAAAFLFRMPRILEWLESKSESPADPAAQTALAVQEEVSEAVDYFGPIRVLGSALILGVGLARSIRR